MEKRELILVRHGIAEEKGLKPDYDRKLTPEGIEKTKIAAQGIAQLIEDRSWELLTSPLLRAKETADLLGEALDMAPVEHAWIADGSRHDLMKAVMEHPRVIVVGHEPTLSEWHYELTGNMYDFKKAAAVLIHFDENGENG